MSDKSYEEIIEIANSVMTNPMVEVWFKFTCESCGARPLFNEVNTIFRSGECCECGYVTDPIIGYGLLVAFKTGGSEDVGQGVDTGEGV